MKKISLISIVFILFGTFVSLAQTPPSLPPQIPEANIKFYVADNGIPTGPFNLLTLQSMVRARKVTQATLVWRDGMNGWTQAGLVTELFGIFSSQLLAQSGSYQNTGYQQQNVEQSSVDYDPNNPQAVNGQKPLTEKEQKFITEKLSGKFHINPTDKAAMKNIFNRYLASGIAMAAVGTVLQSAGAGVMSGLISTSYYYSSYYKRMKVDTVRLILGATIGGSVLLAGTIIGPLCAVGFVNAGKTGNVYKKTTGRKLFSVLSRTGIGGGYDWENHEVTVAMVIKL